jgi:major vault protein
MSKGASATKGQVIRLSPQYFIHILDNNTNTTRLATGPETYCLKDQEEVVFGPERYIVVPPRHYCVISHPVVRDKHSHPVFDKTIGEYKVKKGDEEIRFEGEPFPLFPGEVLSGKVQKLQVLNALEAMHLVALRDFTDAGAKVERRAGEEWLVYGPATYYPRVEVQMVKVVQPKIIKPNQALKLKASKDAVIKGVPRLSGEEWLIKKEGAYLPDVYEEVLGIVDAYSLTKEKALHLLANRTFTDFKGRVRKAGEEWLLTSDETDVHVPEVCEQVVGEVKIISLTSRQYCVVLDPVDKKTGKPQLGKQEVRVGVRSFFLHPGERLVNGIQNVYVLKDEEALLLVAKEKLVEAGNTARKPGDRWMIYGPRDYVPPIEVDVLEKRKTIILGENEGIYIRDLNNGEIRSHLGKCYMLKPNEELFEKAFEPEIETLLYVDPMAQRTMNTAEVQKLVIPPRDKTRVVSYRIPSNMAVQLFDYKTKTNRIVFGPDLVLLKPDEVFTVLSLSGGRPKRPDYKKSLAMLLGPDFMIDLITVDTSDHARLNLQVSYNWQFDIDVNNYTPEQALKIFSSSDYIGLACRRLASLVRGAIARVPFDTFHKHSASIIHNAVFNPDFEDYTSALTHAIKDGDDTTSVAQVDVHPLSFENLLLITGIDIQSVEPADAKTRDALTQSVQLAIEITTKSQEARARQEADRREQEARGKLERQKLTDAAQSEQYKKQLLILKADSTTIEATGRAVAEARASVLQKDIEGQAEVTQAEQKSQALLITSQSDLEVEVTQWKEDVEHQKAMYALEVDKKKKLAAIEAKKFLSLVTAIGADNVKSMALAGPEMQTKLLQSLGLKSVLFTSGNSNVNLFNTTSGFVANPTNVHQ